MKPYYQDDAVTIYHGDCLELLSSIDSVDLIVTDPPFYLPAHIGASRKEWPRVLADVAIMERYFRESFSRLTRLLRPTGAFYTFADSTSFAVFYSILYPLFDRTQGIVWDKGRGGLGHGWRHSHELIVHGAFGATEYADGFRRDVIVCPVVNSDQREHQSEKPVDLFRTLLLAHSGSLVLDPFMGSGTTLRAAKDLGRKAIGIEIEERYCEIAAKRLSQSVIGL